MDAASLYRHLFLFQVCKYIVHQSKTVLPFLHEHLLHLKTIGDGKTADHVRKQLAGTELQSLESAIRDVLLVLSPSTVSQREGSLFKSHWDVNEDMVLKGLSVSRHPAFLSYTFQYFQSMEKPPGKIKDIWKSLPADRIHSENLGQTQLFHEGTGTILISNQFYRTQNVNTSTAISNPDLVSYLDHIGSQLPHVEAFLKVFCYTPKPSMSIISENTELTESSGISSMEPDAVKRRNKENLDRRRLSPRLSGSRAQKRNNDIDPEIVSKRHVLTERN